MDREQHDVDAAPTASGPAEPSPPDDLEPLSPPAVTWHALETSTSPPPSSGEPPTETLPRDRQPSGARVAILAGIIGALVGGGVAGGVVAAVDHNRKGGTTIVRESTPGVPARTSTVLAKPGDIRSILDKVQPAVVRIDVRSGLEQGTGTGFVVDPGGVIVTNAHVVGAQRTVTVTLADGDEVQGRVLGSNGTVDLAVVKIARSGLPTVELGDSDKLQVGDAVVAIGNALGLSSGSGPTVTTGIVSGLHRTVPITNTETLVDAIQTDAAINPGNSGGPLVDVNGRVIGINTAIASPSESNNVGFAIAISSAKRVIAELRSGRVVPIAFLGVKTQSVTPSLVQDQSLKVAKGAYVISVEVGSGAARAGLEKGDVITEIDGTPVTTDDDVLKAVRRHQPGDHMEVVVDRNGSKRTFDVTLGDLSRST